MLVLALLFCVLIAIKRLLKSASTTLFTDGWILTHPNRKSVAFDNASDAMYWVKTCKKAGIILNCYALNEGKITLVEIGDTIIA